jgi:hypothetical protein
MKKASGMMFWTLEGDATDYPSPVKTIYGTAFEK